MQLIGATRSSLKNPWALRTYMSLPLFVLHHNYCTWRKSLQRRKMFLLFSAHPRAAASGAMMRARAELWREAVFERAARLSTHVSGRKTQMLSWRQRKGRGGWMEGLGWMWSERAVVPVSNGWHSHTCPHAHVDTSILAHGSSRTKRFAQLCGAQSVENPI